MKDGVYYSDLRDFAGVLEAASGTTAEDVATQVIHAMGDHVAALAKSYAPKRSGQLAASIAAHKGQRSTRVVASAPYAAYVEFGTWQHNVLNPQSGTYTITPKKPGGVLRFTGKDGKTVFTKKVKHPGIKPQPFMGPATSEGVEAFTQGMGNAGVQLLLVEKP